MLIKKIKLYAGLVCPRRSLDYKKLEKYFLANSCEIVTDPEEATHIIIITCAFIDRNIEESLELIRLCRKYKARLIVGGCIKDITEETLKKNFSGDVFTTKEIERIDDFFPEFTVKFRDVPDANALHDYNEIDSLCGKRSRVVENVFSNKTKFFFWNKEFVIRIGYGCSCKCTFCSHRNAIGEYRSKDPETCLNEFRDGYQKGFRFFRLTSMDTGRYGLDMKSTLPELVNSFLAYAPDVKFILEDVNPMWLNKYSQEILRLTETRKISGIQTPIQSGSPAVLRRMKRWNNTEKLQKIISEIKKTNRLIHLSTELLLGFPGETDEDFRMTMNALKNAGFDFTYIYPYYETKMMDSAAFHPKCDKETIDRRLDTAVSFCNENRISYCVMLNK